MLNQEVCFAYLGIRARRALCPSRNPGLFSIGIRAHLSSCPEGTRLGEANVHNRRCGSRRETCLRIEAPPMPPHEGRYLLPAIRIFTSKIICAHLRNLRLKKFKKNLHNLKNHPQFRVESLCRYWRTFINSETPEMNSVPTWKFSVRWTLL